ncbi:apyrimidinic endonuclease [Pseudovirgaria hyperparasitica]|uniref:DNA-(apurinic or apyrimidinic site) endonuclease 2 n=1 Tax=Pseudovirgaria hyperparasitica TaxID=470096 RepID=A0A6A6W5S0_9PEZI|nr:apyrimidinic endonuclease [Pseudovirgaria hyperparasitica]KAF2757296.1 apyrimidinic endonuclease [Pseudovirgaria hyperparasitica]
MPLRITTWNVNGIRNPFGYQPWKEAKSLGGMFDILEADIVIMQELKIQRKDLQDHHVLVDGWDAYFSLPKDKKGYSGVGIYTRKCKCNPIRAEEGLLGVLCPPNSDEPYCEMNPEDCIGGYPTQAQLEDLGVDVDAKYLDSEGRCVVVEFPAFVLFGIYSPANSNGQRDDFRYGFMCAMDLRIRNLVKMGKRVVVTGDLNVSREPKDTAACMEDITKGGISLDEYISSPNRRVFNQLLEGGPVLQPRDPGRDSPVLWDICRGFHPEREGMYTHWEVKVNARPGNFGSRIDYVLCSLDMKDWFEASDIQAGLHGSDHCPVYAVIKDNIDLNGKPTETLDVMSLEGVFRNSIRQRELNTKEMPEFCARRMPEFYNRRNIKDMFTKRPSLSTQKSAVLTIDDTVAQSSRESAVDCTAQTSNGKGAGKAIHGIKRARPESTQSKTIKRIKSTSLPKGPARPSGQMSMRNFFQNGPLSPSKPSPSRTPASDTTTPPTSTQASNDTEIIGPVASFSPSTPSTKSIHRTCRTPSPTQARSRTPTSTAKTPQSSYEPPLESGSPHDAKLSWVKLFSKKPPPRCEGHEEPCISLKTGKKGANQGREFWICARPLGPKGEKERGSDWRCRTFIWSSDWNSARA